MVNASRMPCGTHHELVNAMVNPTLQTGLFKVGLSEFGQTESRCLCNRPCNLQGITYLLLCPYCLEPDTISFMRKN